MGGFVLVRIRSSVARRIEAGSEHHKCLGRFGGNEGQPVPDFQRSRKQSVQWRPQQQEQVHQTNCWQQNSFALAHPHQPNRTSQDKE